MSLIAGLFAPTDNESLWASAQQRFLARVVRIHPHPVLVRRPGLLLALTEGMKRSTLPLHVDIAGQARLDNREELLSILGYSDQTITDLELVGLAYLRWKDALATRLAGDFSVAIQDRLNNRLVGLRDPFGVASFYYRHESESLSFSGRQAVLVDASDEPEKNRLTDFLIGLDDDPTATMFRSVLRLPAAHKLSFGPEGNATVSRYWSPQAKGSSDKAPGARLLHSLKESVRLRDTGKEDTAALLSGGLDSSVIAALAAMRRSTSPLQTYSFGYAADSGLDESRHVAAVAKHCHLATRYVDMSSFDPIGDAYLLLSPDEDPFFAPGIGKLMRIFRQARDDGVTVLLDGHGGDEVVSHGLGQLPELLRSRRWLSLWQVAGAAHNVFGTSRAETLWQLLSDTDFGRRVRRHLPVGGGKGATAPARFLSQNLLSGSDLRDRAVDWAKRFARARRTENALHIWNISSPALVRSLEILTRSASLAGVKLAFPFFDRSVVEAALSVPSEQKTRAGHTRYVLRRAVAGILPDSVRWRRDKVDFAPEFRRGLARQSGFLHALSDSNGTLADIIDRKLVASRVQHFLAAPDHTAMSDIFILMRLAILAVWLDRRSDLRPEAGKGARL